VVIKQLKNKKSEELLQEKGNAVSY
jgi:hypothetical protein